MAKHRAIIVGAGRMGSGFGLGANAHYYVHAKSYRDLKDRVDLMAFVEPDKERAEFARKKWGVQVVGDLREAFKEFKPDIVSLCTQPEQRQDILIQCIKAGVKGVWCEKPFALKIFTHAEWPLIQVNYCRRFDRFHQKVKAFMKEVTASRLVVMAKKDVHTVCHLTDLARWWNVDKLDYVDTPGEPGAYMLRYKVKDKVWLEQFFPSGGLAGDEFMKCALENLLDAVEGKAELLSPAENAIKSEEWANQLLEVK